MALPSPVRRALFLGTFAAFSAFLMVCGGRQLVAGLLGLPANAVLNRLQERTGTVDTHLLHRFAATEQASLAMRSQAAGWSSLGLALAIEAERDDTAERSVLLGQARQAVVESLALAPANPYAWSRLAVIEQALGEDRGVAASHWRLAVMTGPVEDWLYLARARTAIALWPELTDKDHAAVFSAIQWLWRYQAPSVLQLAEDPFSLNVVRASLAADPRQLIAFEKLKKAPGRT